MAFDADEIILFRFCYEVFLHFSIRQIESHIHAASGVFLCVTFVEAIARIDHIIDEPCLDLVSFFDGRKAAHVFDPVEHAVQRVDAEDGRCIEGGVLLDEGLILKEFRYIRPRRGEKRFLQDGERHARSAEILLDACPDHIELAKIDDAGENIRGHVANERRIDFREFPVLCTVDGVVRAEVEVVGSRFHLIGVRDVGVISVRCGIGIIGFSEKAAEFLALCAHTPVSA